MPSQRRRTCPGTDVYGRVIWEMVRGAWGLENTCKSGEGYGNMVGECLKGFGRNDQDILHTCMELSKNK